MGKCRSITRVETAGQPRDGSIWALAHRLHR
jgi:hypothetical protein